MSGVSCHVLDIGLGRPAAGVPVRLERRARPAAPAGASESWELLGQGMTNADGRVTGLEGAASLASGEHRITFETGHYLQRTGQQVFYPEVQVRFVVAAPVERYHIPLLLSPFGYSTYRGS